MSAIQARVPRMRDRVDMTSGDRRAIYSQAAAAQRAAMRWKDGGGG